MQIAGAGAELETHEALLGLATVRIREGTPGGHLRIRVPKFGFDLLVRRTGPLTFNLEVRQSGGPWEPVDPDRVWPRQSLDLRFTFSRPVDEQAAADRVSEALRAGWSLPGGRGYKVTPSDIRWEDGALLLHVENPVPLLVFSLANLKDKDGLGISGPVRLLRTGSPPVLVAAGERDAVIAQVPVEITEAVVGPDGQRLHLSRWAPNRTGWLPMYEKLHFTLDLATGSLTPGEPPEVPGAAQTSCKVERAGNFRLSPAGDKLVYNQPEPWGAVRLLDLRSCATTDLGPGWPAGWDAQGRPLVIRWEESRDRYNPDRNTKR